MPTSGGVFGGLSPAVSWSVAERRAPLEILEGLSPLFSAGWEARSTRRSGNGAPLPTVGVIDFPEGLSPVFLYRGKSAAQNGMIFSGIVPSKSDRFADGDRPMNVPRKVSGVHLARYMVASSVGIWRPPREVPNAYLGRCFWGTVPGSFLVRRGATGPLGNSRGTVPAVFCRLGSAQHEAKW